MLFVGKALQVLTWVLIVQGFMEKDSATVVYWLFVSAHAFNLSGFALTAYADRVSGRPFAATRLLYIGFVELVMITTCPVKMSAIVASQKVLHLR